MDAGSLTKIHEALMHLTSTYGKSVMGTCKLLTKEEVETMVHMQGSTGALDDGHTLGEFMLLNPSWYSDAMDLINRWNNGQSTQGYFTCRPKNEPKVKKCVEGGKITVTDEESLREHNEQGHRFIQFADSLTRLAHYILLGHMLRKGGKQKLYKGTVNGTPPMYLGRVIRAMWDMNSEECNREIAPKSDGRSDVRYEIFNSEKLGGKGPPTGVCLDYSGWDTTVTLGERIVEADYFAKFYPGTLRNAIMNCFRETACPITVDDDGNIWLRAGQRGSGELMTSVGNTALVAANTAVAVAACTGLSVAEVCETVGTLEYLIGYKGGLPQYKKIEVTRFCQMSDGDDTFLVTTSEWATAIINNLEEVLSLQNKKIRSGQTGGAKRCERFEDIEFCSHSYHKVDIGNKRWWLPYRPIADILSKMRLTLKVSTSKWDPANSACVDITRSKILSYLLLYPHIRAIRYNCISLLSITGDGTFSHDEFSRRWEWMSDLSKMTAMGAVNSIYRVGGLDEIGYVKYKDEFAGLLTLRRNTALTNNITRINVREYVCLMFRAMLILGIRDSGGSYTMTRLR